MFLLKLFATAPIGFVHNFQQGTFSPNPVTNPTDALFIGALETDIDLLPGAGSTAPYEHGYIRATMDINIYDETVGDADLHDGVYVDNHVANLASGVQMQGGFAWENSGTNPILSDDMFTPMEIKYTNLGGGQMGIQLRMAFLDEEDGDGDLFRAFNYDIATAQGSPTIVSSAIVNHGFSDLSQLYPGVGTRISDSNVSNTGAAFDWQDGFLEVIPEPSSAVLAGVGVMLLGLRRRRK